MEKGHVRSVLTDFTFQVTEQIDDVGINYMIKEGSQGVEKLVNQNYYIVFARFSHPFSAT